MIFVDSSVWVDYFNGRQTSQVVFLYNCLGLTPIATGDIIISEVLRGFKSDKAYLKAKDLLSSLHYDDMLGIDNAIKSANMNRELRKKGITFRKINDLFIGCFCLVNNMPLLHNDQDFLVLEKHFGLRLIKT